MALTYATVCSGVEGVSLAWEPLGLKPVFFSEVDADASKVLKHHWRMIPNLGNMLAIDGADWRGLIDILWGSYPCQDFSEGGKQAGLLGVNGALTLAGLELVDEIDPPVFCFENVPNLLRLKKENPFGQFLGRLAGAGCPLVPPGDGWKNAGYVLGPRRAIAWRVLDAQHFGLAQQRERVFVVACSLASGLDPRAVLFERRAAGDAAAQRPRVWTPFVPGASGCAVAPATAVAIRGRGANGKTVQQIEQGGLVANCLRASQGGSDKGQVLVRDADGEGWTVRNLLPVECERLMGMPDNHTLAPGVSESARYHQIGNSLAVPVVRWIGERILREWEAAHGPA